MFFAVASGLLHGALFGFMAYATYDLSILATLRGYTTTIALVDLTWRTVLTSISSTPAFFIARYLRLA